MTQFAKTPPLKNAPNVTVHIASMLTGRSKADVIAAASNPENNLQWEPRRRIGQRIYQMVEREEIIAHFLKVAAAEAESEANQPCESAS